MAVNQLRYSNAREAYFSAGKPPPVPPKQDRQILGGERRVSSPTSSPHHSSKGCSPTHPSGHYTEYSHSVPRNHGRSHPQGQVTDVGKKTFHSTDRSIVRSCSFSCSSTTTETPPSIPPRPATNSPLQIQKTFKRKQPTFLTSDLSFDQLIRQHQKSFPLRVYITNGYLGATSRLTISTGDVYNIHFVKHTRVMLFRDHHETPYSIPLNSAIEFGLLYEPKEGRKPTDVDIGVVFTSVGDLLAQPEVPKVVAVVKTWQSDDGKISLLTNEVLIIKSVQRSVFAKKGVRVISVTTKSDKFLPEDCSAQFSTQPAQCRLHITDIVDHIKQPKGTQCVLFLNSQVLINRELSSSMQAIPDELFEKVLTIVGQVTETSLIASSMLRREVGASEDDFDPDRDTLFDIPVDDNTAEVTCAIVKISQTDRLYDTTKTLYEKFDPTRLMSVKDTGSENSHETQKLLYTTIRRGCEGLGVEIDRPEGVYAVIHSQKHLEQPLPTPPASASSSSTASPGIPPSKTSSPRLPHQSTDHTDHEDGDDIMEYDDITPESLKLIHSGQLPNLQTVSVTRSNSQSITGLGKRVAEVEQQLQQNQTQMASLHSKLEQSMGHIGELESEVSRMKTVMEKLLPQIYALQSRLTHITNLPQSKSPAAPPVEEEGEDEGEDTDEKNKKYLQSLTTQEVCQLLEAMDLGQYKDTFTKECVSGEIMLECDNDILQCDLGVVSRLHRVRLMKVVTGRHSAASLIEGADPYVTLSTS